ncbi:MAG TPA: hypothetical protein VHY58_21655 [Streptosporangiaceae bacterium]|nr:hypothetical protein [Streptosporangiaceae bacterium]
MTTEPEAERPYVDALSMSDREAHVYEAIAAMEYSARGRPASRAEIKTAAGLDDDALDETLRELTERRALVRTGSGEDAEYTPASHDWSVAPPDK